MIQATLAITGKYLAYTKTANNKGALYLIFGVNLCLIG